MDAKLNQSDLISLLAKGSNISVAKAELFTKNFFDLIIEGLEQDGIVKINGLGTFKITDVASRDSVNVNTGEKIEIKGHKKLTFIPADTLKEEVNQPFAMFEPVEVDDTYLPESSDDAETEDAAEPVENTNTTIEVVETPIIVETPTVVEEIVAAAKETALPETNKGPVAVIAPAEAQENNVVNETVPTVEEEKKKEPVVEVKPEAVVVQERPAEPVIVRVPQKKSTEEKHIEPAESKKSRWYFFLIVIMAVAVALIFINRRETGNVVAVENGIDVKNSLAVNDVVQDITEPERMPQTGNSDADSTDVQGVTNEVEPQVEVTVVNEPVAEELQPADTYTFVMVEELASMSLKDITLTDTTHYFAEGELCKHTVAVNETLTKIARLYYGDKKLWPYIVEYNNMKNPDGLCCGMQISIPRLIPRR